MRDGFFYFENYRNIAKNLPDDLRLKFFDALNDYMFEGKEPEDNIIKALITALKPSLDKVETRGGNNNPFGCKGKPKEKEDESKDNQNESKKIKNESKDNQENQSFNKQEIKNKKEEKNNISSDKSSEILQKKKKLNFSDVLDWESLITYWEENKRGGKYKNQESRQRMLEKLKKLTENDFDYAKQAICHCLDSGYQGFCNGNELFYKGPKPQWKTINAEPNAYDEFSLALEEMKRRVAQ